MNLLNSLISVLAWQVFVVVAQVPNPCDISSNKDYPNLDDWIDGQWYVVEWTSEDAFKELLVGDTSNDYPIFCPRLYYEETSANTANLTVAGYYNDPNVQSELTNLLVAGVLKNSLSGSFRNRETNEGQAFKMSLLATDQGHNFAIIGTCVYFGDGSAASTGSYWTLSRHEREAGIDQKELISTLEGLGLRRNMFVDNLMENCP